MLIIISPAKIQNFTLEKTPKEYTIPQFLNEATELIEKIKPYSNEALSDLLEINAGIAQRSSDSYYNWKSEHNIENAKQAIFVYNGEVYRGLDVRSFSTADVDYAGKHLRMLSALYGVLRPLDIIQPYRLEMNAKLGNSAGNDLYKFWKTKITETINKAVEKSGSPKVIINLASHEYSKSLDTKKLSAEVISIEFLENRNGVYKAIVIYTKKARGLMARYIIQNRIENTEDIKGFDAEGYWFNNSLSTENKYIFTRG